MKRTILASLAAAVTTTVFAAPTDTDNALVKDTTKVIDIEEVVVIATPKENNRRASIPFRQHRFRKMKCVTTR